MTKTEKTMISTEKEIAKVTKSLERYEAICAKKEALCIKLGCNWTEEEWMALRDTEIPQKQLVAHLELGVAATNVDDTKYRLEKLEIRLARVAKQFAEENAKNEAFREMLQQASEQETKLLTTKSEEEYQIWLKQFKEDCLKDGITVEDACSRFVYGTTPTGKRFMISSNNGHAERSWHCYSVRVENDTLFTSGEFWRAYRAVKMN